MQPEASPKEYLPFMREHISHAARAVLVTRPQSLADATIGNLLQGKSPVGAFRTLIGEFGIMQPTYLKAVHAMLKAAAGDGGLVTGLEDHLDHVIRRAPRAEGQQEHQAGQGEAEDEDDNGDGDRKDGEGEQDGGDGNGGRNGGSISNAMNEAVALASGSGAGQPQRSRDEGSGPRSPDSPDDLHEDIKELRGALGELVRTVGQLNTTVRDLAASRATQSQSRKRDSTSVVDVTPPKPPKQAATGAQRVAAPPTTDAVRAEQADAAAVTTPPPTAAKAPRGQDQKAAAPAAAAETKKAAPEDFKPLVSALF